MTKKTIKSSLNLKVVPPKKGKEATQGAQLTLAGELTISNSTELKSFLEENLGKYESFNILIDNPQAIDLTCIQLLQSFATEAKTLGKTVSMDAELPEDINLLLNRSGLTTLFQQNSNN